MRWVFWDVDADALDSVRDRDHIIPRILEFGGIAEVRWLMKTYGTEGIHAFLRDIGHPEIGPRTLRFWRAVLRADEETWASPPAWRETSGAPWLT
jgi:hypothetical protein